MIDGLRYLHGQGIIHRDIHLSYLILKCEWNDVNVVIIDYETAFDSGGNHSTGNEVDCSGGYICWLKQLLQSREQSYMPKPADDLFTYILVVLHLFFHANLMSSMQGTFQPTAIKTLRHQGYYKCGGILRLLKYEDSFIKQQGIKTMMDY